MDITAYADSSGSLRVKAGSDENHLILDESRSLERGGFGGSLVGQLTPGLNLSSGWRVDRIPGGVLAQFWTVEHWGDSLSPSGGESAIDSMLVATIRDVYSDVRTVMVCVSDSFTTGEAPLWEGRYQGDGVLWTGGLRGTSSKTAITTRIVSLGVSTVQVSIDTRDGEAGLELEGGLNTSRPGKILADRLISSADGDTLLTFTAVLVGDKLGMIASRHHVEPPDGLYEPGGLKADWHMTMIADRE